MFADSTGVVDEPARGGIGLAGLAGVVIAFVLGLSGCGGDSESSDVRIDLVVDETLHSGTFTAEGDLVCSDGTFANTNPAPDEEIGIIPTRHQFRCADNSGIFFVEVDGELDPDAEGDGQAYAGTWVLGEGGLGDYAEATGSGTMRGATEPTWTESYEGTISGG